MQLLEEENIRIVSHIASIAGIADEGIFPASTLGKPFPTLSEARGEEMLAAIAKARADGDSVGGVVECAVLGLPAGLGDALFDGVESCLSAALFGIPAVKGVEFGAGFAAAALRGSENNDAFVLRGGRAMTETNRCGGILGGITTARRSCSARRSSRRRPSRGGSAPLISPPCAKRRSRSPAGMTPASCRAPFPAWKRRQRSCYMIFFVRKEGESHEHGRTARQDRRGG